MLTPLICNSSTLGYLQTYPEAADDHEGRETDSNINQKLMYHVMGTDQSNDVVVAEFPDNPKWMR